MGICYNFSEGLEIELREKSVIIADYEGTGKIYGDEVSFEIDYSDINLIIEALKYAKKHRRD